jgi:hypothetical protein
MAAGMISSTTPSMFTDSSLAIGLIYLLDIGD